MIYVLNGWVKFWYEDEGEFLLEKGDFVYHPPTAAHDLLDYSADVELLEVYSPSSPETIDVWYYLMPNSRLVLLRAFPRCCRARWFIVTEPRDEIVPTPKMLNKN
jgi:uncharacterized cupin superfamily protein